MSSAGGIKIVVELIFHVWEGIEIRPHTYNFKDAWQGNPGPDPNRSGRTQEKWRSIADTSGGNTRTFSRAQILLIGDT
jgi:hypothetical protein